MNAEENEENENNFSDQTKKLRKSRDIPQPYIATKTIIKSGKEIRVHSCNLCDDCKDKNKKYNVVRHYKQFHLGKKQVQIKKKTLKHKKKGQELKINVQKIADLEMKNLKMKKSIKKRDKAISGLRMELESLKQQFEKRDALETELISSYSELLSNTNNMAMRLGIVVEDEQSFIKKKYIKMGSMFSSKKHPYLNNGSKSHMDNISQKLKKAYQIFDSN